jgi:hypothetical protein
LLELGGPFFGDEVWREEPGSDMLPMLVLFVVPRLSQGFDVSTTNESNRDVEKFGKPHELVTNPIYVRMGMIIEH